MIQYLTCLNNGSLLDHQTNFEEFKKCPCSNYTQSGFEVKKFADKLKEMVCMLIGCTREQLENREFKETLLGKEWGGYQVSWECPIDEWEGFFATEEEALNYLKSKGATECDLENPYKCKLIRKLFLTPRLLLQLLGTDCGRKIIHPNVWINALFADYKPSLYYMCDECMNDDILPFEFTESLKEDQCPRCKYVSEGNLTQVIDTDGSNWIITDVRFPNEADTIKSKGGILIRVNRPCKECGGMGYHKMDCSIGRCEHESEYALDNYEHFDHVIDNDGTIEDLLQKIKEIINN